MLIVSGFKFNVSAGYRWLKPNGKALKVTVGLNCASPGGTFYGLPLGFSQRCMNGELLSLQPLFGQPLFPLFQFFGLYGV